MPIDIKAGLGGSGGFITKFASNTVSVSSGATGTYITLTPPTNQRVMLTGLASGGAKQTNETTITVGGNIVLSGGFLEQVSNTQQPVDADELLIGFGYSNQSIIMGDVDEVIEISTNVATSQGTVYAYQFGV